jgi:cytochrome bd-type quinol oxidase subunit 2
MQLLLLLLSQVFESLSGAEQLGLMSSLGSYHVWATLARPDGLHFRLDLTQNEQRDVAREVVKVGGSTSGLQSAGGAGRLLAGAPLEHNANLVQTSVWRLHMLFSASAGSLLAALCVHL